MPWSRFLVVLAPTLLLAGCLGAGPDHEGCGAWTESKLEGLPFSHTVNAAERDGRSVWLWTMVTQRACLDQTLVLEGTVRVAAPQAALAHCPTGDAAVVLSASAAGKEAAPARGTAEYDGGDAVFRMRTEFDLRQLAHGSGVIGILEVSLPKTDDPAKARECAMDRLKVVEMEAGYFLPKEE